MRTRFLVGGCGLGLVTAVALGCGSSSAEEDRFASTVVPVLEQRCASSSCHGAQQGAAAQQLDAQKWLTFTIDGAGHIADPAAALASVKAKLSSENPAFSSFLRKTLPIREGGKYHYQGSVFGSRSDPDFVALSTFAETVTDGTEGASEAAFTAEEQRFASDVYPLLINRGCATATCHGSLMFGGAVFASPALPGTLELPRAEMRATYLEARRNLTLWGDPLRSRLLTKILPLEKGGVLHKGGNDVFFASDIEAGRDPRTSASVQAILGWIAAERAATLGKDAAPWPKQPSIVFVGGPLPAAGPFEVQPYTPGTNLYRLDPPYTGAPVNLTNAPATADIRDPAVSHDGTTIVYSMRTSASDAHNLYLVGVDGNGARKLTSDAAAGPGGATLGNFAPVFGPNGGFAEPGSGAPERIYWSSTRAGDASDVVAQQNADLYAMDVDGTNVERLTYTVVPEVQPTFLSTGEFQGTLAYTLRRSAEGGYKGVLFRFPVDHNRALHVQPEAHPHFGMSEPPKVFYRLRELPDGRAALVLLDEKNVWRGGQLALLERQFAVEVPDGSEKSATLPGFRHALTVLTPDAAREGASAGGLWRDPIGLPDGSILVARSKGAIDLADRKASPHTELVRIVLDADRTTNRPTVKSTDLVFGDAKLSASQPVAVYPRPPEDAQHERAWTNDDAPATLVHSGLPVIEAVIAQLSPLAPRTLREDIAFMRAVVPLSVAGALDTTAVPADETRNKMEGATRVSLTGRMPLFAAAEVPPAADGSIAAHIPAKVSVRVVTLDADHLAVGALQHQWYATLPSERFPVGIPQSSYNASCGGCHGAMDGKPNSVLDPPTDFITQASVTASLYEGSDRRVPKELPTVGASMFVLVDFQKDVTPILDAKCATSGCHAGASPAGELSLTSQKTQHYTDAYESLLAPGEGSANGFKYVDAAGYRARGSYLAERIMGREYDAPRALGRSCPPSGPALTAEERITLVRWIEFGAAFVGVPAPAK